MIYKTLNVSRFVKQELCPECVEPEAYVEIHELQEHPTGSVRFNATIHCFSSCGANVAVVADTAFDAVRSVILKYRGNRTDTDTKG